MTKPLAVMKAPLQQALAAKVDRKPKSKVASTKKPGGMRKRGTAMNDLVIDSPVGVNTSANTYSGAA